MKKTVLSLLVLCLMTAVLGGCAASPEEYSTEHNPQYAITYLVTDFEAANNRNAESVFRNESPMGWNYMFDDSKSLEDYVVPHAMQSEMCRNLDDDTPLFPQPPECSIITGYQVNEANPFTEFGSTTSFHWSGVAVASGVGFGTYFADYLFHPVYDPTQPNRLLRDKAGRLPATFSAGRKLSNGTPLCKDDADFAGTVDPIFNSPARVPFLDRYATDKEGKYAVEGSIYTEGEAWVDTDGMEHFELAYEHQTTLKEPRCLGDMGQEGLVLWATGNAKLEVALLLQETAPLTDGGICDEAGGEKCYDHPTVVFELDDQWREYHAAWDEFVQEGWGKPVQLDPNKIINIQLKVNGPKSGDEKTFDIWMDQIGFYGGTTWEFVRELNPADSEN